MLSDLLLRLLGLRYGFNMKSYRQLVSESFSWSEAQWAEYHGNLLKIMIRHAYEHVPYYHELFNRIGLDPFSIENVSDLEKIPITRKSDVMQNPSAFIADNYSNYHYMHHHTGGTTGIMMPYLNDRKSWALNWAIKMEMFERAGYHYGKDMLAVMAGGSLIPKRNMGFKHKIWRCINNYESMPIMHLTPEMMEHYYKIIIEKKIKFLRGYPSAISTFADYINTKHYSLPLKAVFTTAEMLYPYQRDLIKLAFGCDTWDAYGCGDGMGHAIDCECHDKKHICEQVSIMQIVDSNGCEVEANKEGEIVLTSLYDFAMPFIRYAPGDIAVKGDNDCCCGIKSKTLNKVMGRSSDVFRFTNGRILNGLSFPIEDLLKEIRRYQLVHIEQDYVKLYIEQNVNITKDRINKLKNLVEYHCGEGVRVEIEIVDKIAIPVSEKFRYIVNRVE